MTASAQVTVGICTRNRPDELRRCLASLGLGGGLLAEALVVDDGSEPPAGTPGAVIPSRVFREAERRGTAAGRNRLLQAAATPYLLCIDDDAFLLADAGIRQAVELLDRDPKVAVVALSQLDGDGTPWPSQPASATGPVQVASFTGYGFLARREALLSVGGFMEPLEINGEEREICLRLLDAGWRVIYLPDAGVAHVASASERDARRYLHQTVRNDVLSAAHAFPAPLWPALAAVRLMRYFPMRRGWGIHDPGGLRTILGEVGSRLPATIRDRRPVRWSTLRRWRTLVRQPEPYTPPVVP